MQHIYDVVVVGAGAAGMAGALFAARAGLRVAVFEHNPHCGKKLAITGKGRCNLTNDCDRDEFLRNIPTNARFLYSAISQFSCADTMALFESLGVRLKVERGRRVFPVSDRAREVVDALENACIREGVRFFYQSHVKKLLTDAGKASGILCGGEHIPCGSVMLATGGASYPTTGSDGSGYALARGIGHTLTPLRPSLVPIETSGPYASRMMGLSLKNVTLSVREQPAGRCVFTQQGEMLFTHFGVSGPLVLSASSYIDPARAYTLSIDFKPALDEQTLDRRLVREVGENPRMDFSNLCRHLLPATAIPVFLELLGVAAHQKAGELTREKRRAFTALLKDFPLTFSAFRPLKEAIVTAGGVDVREVSPKTMESKKVSGLYFAGELLDVDGFTGGYNLQIAFCTAYAAAQAVAAQKS